MDNKEQENIKSTNNETKQELNRIHLNTKDYQMDLTIRKLKNPTQILEKMYQLRENRELSDEEKNEEVRKIMTEYLR